MNISTPSIPNSCFQSYIRVATDADRPRLIALVNSAFSIETFLEGTRQSLRIPKGRGNRISRYPGYSGCNAFDGFLNHEHFDAFDSQFVFSVVHSRRNRRECTTE